MKTKYQLLLKGKKDIKAAEIEAKREEVARYLIATLSQASEWVQINSIKYLAMYIDFDFVKKALIKQYNDSSTSEEVRIAIRKLHDKTLDLTDVLEEYEFAKSFNYGLQHFEEESLEEIQPNEKTITSQNLMFKKYSSHL